MGFQFRPVWATIVATYLNNTFLISNLNIPTTQLYFSMKLLRTIIILPLLLIIVGEAYLLLTQQKLSLPDILPQPIKSSSYLDRDAQRWYSSTLPKNFDSNIVDKNYFPYEKNGEIYPPKKYDVGNNYSEQDIGKMKLALRTAYRYADINKALQDGYRVSDSGFAIGMGIHVQNIEYMLDNEISVEKPEFLLYIRNAKTDRFQLAQLGFITQSTKPYKLFDAKSAQGHFHAATFCGVVKNDVFFDRFLMEYLASKDGSGFLVNPARIQDLHIYDNLEFDWVTTNRNCDEAGGKKIDPIWMMHFAVNMYNEFGMFSDYFPYVDYLSSEALTYSFFGEKI